MPLIYMKGALLHEICLDQNNIVGQFSSSIALSTFLLRFMMIEMRCVMDNIGVLSLGSNGLEDLNTLDLACNKLTGSYNVCLVSYFYL